MGADAGVHEPRAEKFSGHDVMLVQGMAVTYPKPNCGTRFFLWFNRELHCVCVYSIFLILWSSRLCLAE